MVLTNKCSLNIGAIPKGNTFKDVIEITNKSDRQLMLAPWVGCSCTEAYLDKGILEQDQTVKLNVKYTPTHTGLDEKQFGVVYKPNETTECKLIITIIAKVI